MFKWLEDIEKLGQRKGIIKFTNDLKGSVNKINSIEDKIFMLGEIIRIMEKLELDL